MSTRILGWLALVALLFSALWLVFLIAGIVANGSADGLDDAIAGAAQQDTLFVLTYINAALVTLSVTAFMVELYRFVRESIPAGSLIGLLFLPAYTIINLFAYLSQITIVPALAAAMQDPAAMPAARLMLSQMLQSWPGSGIAFFNTLAYGLLGIPSILFGMVIWRSSYPLRYGGLMLVLNGIACILGVIGALTGSTFLSSGTLAGGVLFILALPFIAVGMLKR